DYGPAILKKKLKMKRNTSMADKQKVHVFLGAPNPQSLSEEATDKSTNQWRTLEFSWNQGRLRPRKEATEGQIHSQVAAEAISIQNPTTDQEKHSFAVSQEGNVTLSEDDITPSISQSSLGKHAPEEDGMSPRLVTEYLDSCFSSPQAEPISDPEPSPAISAKTEYLSTWTKTQGLLLKPGVVREHGSGSVCTLGSPQTPPKQTSSISLGSPELYSPEVSPGDRGLGGTLQESVELYESLSQRLQEGGVILLRTPDGLLCSQASAVEQEDNIFQFGSPDKSVETSPTPSTSKRPKLSSAATWNQQGTGRENTFRLHGPTTLLSRCVSHGVSYSILVGLVHPCHVKEISVKSGASAGSSVPLATLIVTDQSGVEMKVVLWRAAAFWALTVYPGDILLITGCIALTGVTVHEDKWRGETVLQSSYMSQLLNLGQITQSHNPEAPHNVNIHTLRALCTYLYEKRPLLVSLPPRTAQNLESIPFVRLGSLRPDTLVHALLRVKHTRMISDWRSEAEGVSRTGSVPKAVLTVEQGDGRQGAVVLWGTALTWLQHIHTNNDAVWELRSLLVKQDVTSGLLELHSTPWSSCQVLHPSNPRYKEFFSTVTSHRGSSFEIDLPTLLSQKYTGDVELRVHIVAFQFHSSPSQNAVLLMDGETPLEKILDIVSGDVTFTGCGLCCAELDTDENGIYRPCYLCLPHTGVRRYYRTVVLTVREGQCQVCVHVPPTLVQKILLNTPPDKLNKTVAHFWICTAVLSMAGALSMDESQYGMKMFDNEFVMDVSYHQLMPSFEIKNEPFVPETAHGPYLQIIEEPKQRGFRFRYECEGPSHGGLPGASSERNRRTYPTVKVCNYVGHARVEVQLVTHTDPPRVHAHSLVGKQCNDNGTCSIDVGPSDLTAQFSNLGILHVTKRGVVDVLTKRLREERKRAKHPGYHFTDSEEQAIVREAKELGKNMDLNIVRLKFTAYLKDSNGGFTRALKPVVSNPIYDSKSPNASNLKISRMDKTCGSVMGGDEIFLLCDKVQKDDIEIRFYEEDDEGGWEAYGDFSPTDVHKQYAIVFKTPAYHKDIERPVTVFLQLKRKKGGDCSEPKQFTYIPQYPDKEEVLRKRMKSLPQQYDHWRGPQGGAGGLGRGAGGFGGPGGGGGGGGGLLGGFQFNHLDGTGFYGGSCVGFTGGTQMAESAPQPEKTQEQQQQQQQEMPTSLTTKQQLLHFASALQKRSTTAALHSAKALLDYCCTGDVRFLLTMQRQLCGVQDENGDTPLHLAIIHQQPAVATKLIQAIMNTPQFKYINKFNHLSQTPLHLAVITQQPRLVEVMLKVGADPTLLDRDGRTAVHLAALAGDEAFLRMLLNMLGERHSYLLNTADFSGLYPLHLAVRKGGERCLRALVEAGAKINMPEQKSGCTALHLAVKENLFKVACTLITELKADINACTFGGNSPLHLAASLGSPPLCSILIAAGADKQLENDEPLFSYSSSSDEEDQDVGRENVGGLNEQDLDKQVQEMLNSSESRRVNPRKRPAVGHTPFDLANCQKVRDLLDSPKPSHISSKKTKKSTEDVSQPLDTETVSKLCGILNKSQVSWKELAEKLGMLTLAQLYQDSPSPCQNLLENYQLSGGPLEGLVDALQSLGLTEGAQLLRNKQPSEDKQNTDTTVDSGFASQETDTPTVAND
ncbi:hypothetical protein QTP70_019124, partial [Hemibagrus guttatus]